MLFVVVLEFFLCWTPLYVINTITLFDHKIIYQNLGYTAISFFQLLAYSSSCCNPITYCFMNIGFRKAFLNLFRCFNSASGPARRVSLSGYGGIAAPQITIPNFQPMNLTDITNPNNNLLTNSSGSENFDFSRQPSLNVQKKHLNEIRCDRQIINNSSKTISD